MKSTVSYYLFTFLLSIISITSSCAEDKDTRIVVGAENTSQYLSFLHDKNIALVANQSSLVNGEHLVDFLLKKEIKIKRIFSPEHGFRGKADAGEKIKDARDKLTGIKIVSLYGKHYKASPADVKGIDVMLFDLQDVGVRFYTYLSTLHYVMEICAEQNIPLIVLDRPNPNAHYIDGPVLEMKYSSFVGMHPVPVVYGMTIGEYAKMINGEKWLKNGMQCDLRIVPCKNWIRNQNYKLPVKPSPNLPNSLAITLYPSLCFFEGTPVSAGRGTDYPFQLYGHPLMNKTDFTFTPRSIPGASKYPKFKGKLCNGFDLQQINENEFRAKQKLDLSYLITAYSQLNRKVKFFNAFFKNLAGTEKLKMQLQQGMLEEEIRESWQKDIAKFKHIRKKYLIYDDVNLNH
ncbi:exo-beta-N-acetylmuramidase NamZ family protein [Marinifilum sp. RC60d5]|uniref:exo-beta-N-acetylmuramidase NamZ family protein n=1 Tax=Marinifilum sp. RC60d5 TaxID=3458414 RepID=UPI00403625C4